MTLNPGRRSAAGVPHFELWQGDDVGVRPAGLLPARSEPDLRLRTLDAPIARRPPADEPASRGPDLVPVKTESSARTIPLPHVVVARPGDHLAEYPTSDLISHRESIKAVQERLGHSSGVASLNTYSQLWPDSHDRTRAAVDAVLRTAAGQVRAEPGLPGRKPS